MKLLRASVASSARSSPRAVGDRAVIVADIAAEIGGIVGVHRRLEAERQHPVDRVVGDIVDDAELEVGERADGQRHRPRAPAARPARRPPARGCHGRCGRCAAGRAPPRHRRAGLPRRHGRRASGPWRARRRRRARTSRADGRLPRNRARPPRSGRARARPAPASRTPPPRSDGAGSTGSAPMVMPCFASRLGHAPTAGPRSPSRRGCRGRYASADRR